MSDDYTAVRDLMREARQNRSDVFVRQPVEAITLNAGAPHFTRNRHQFGNRGLAAMKRRVEAGDLRTPGRRSATASIAARLCG
jgi:hypothetical protein